ncbi:MAG: site-specific integrase, partial [Proteobacteria bacterium]|nr:site-specific integrase [Pseudomonadota bacterium]
MPNGKYRKRTFQRKTDAIAWKNDLQTDIRRGLVGLPSTQKIPFESVARDWFESRVATRLAHKSIQTYRYTLHGQVLPHFEGQLLSRITHSMIEELRNKHLRAGMKSKTINRIMTMVRQIFEFAIDQGHLAQSPIKKSLYLKDEKKQVCYFEKNEADTLLRANQTFSTYPVLSLALNTGMRLGEILGLCWDRVNFNSNRIEITRTLHRKGFLQEKTKGGRARYFPMNETIRNLLNELKSNQKHPSFVFTNRNGDPFNPDHFSGRNFKRACQRAGVRSLRFHDLRHTFASHFMMRGGSVFQLKELLGHT